MLVEDKKRSLPDPAGPHPARGGQSADGAARGCGAFGNDCLPPPLDALIGKVTARPAQVTGADFAAAKAAGYNEDQPFELVACAAVGQSARLYDAGLAALAEAAADEEAG